MCFVCDECFRSFCLHDDDHVDDQHLHHMMLFHILL
jgi:hypothetical protein